MNESLRLSREDWDRIKDDLDLDEEVTERIEEEADVTTGVVFLESERELIVTDPDSEELRRLSRVAHNVSSSAGTYKFKVEDMDIWNSSLELEEIRELFRELLPEEHPGFMEWLQRIYERQQVFSIEKSGMEYVLTATSEERMEWARDLEEVDENLRVHLTDTKSSIAAGSQSRAAIKRALIRKGYPVQDDYKFKEVDASIGAELTIELRDYQQEMLEEAWRRRACVLANPSGSGKTVTSIGMIAKADAPTLILVPQRSLVSQWKEEILDKTTLEEDQIGQYHGDEKNMEDVTIATYHIAASKTSLFRQDWGLIIFDEVHHIPSQMFRKTADLQSTRRLGLSASPVREDSRERDIFALIGPEIGGDWGYFFDQGHVLQPEVTIHMVPWADASYRNRYQQLKGIKKQIFASKNPQKEEVLEELLDDRKTIIFCDWLDQAEKLSSEFDVPQVTGETDHDVREERIQRFREGELDRLIVSRIGDEGLDIPDAGLCIVMSGQGGSRRQAAQRAGRVMRPQGDADVHFVATKGSVEEDFVKRQMQLMKEKGITVDVEE